MRMLACAVLAAAATVQASEAAEERYDHRLDRAAAEIAASRMGSLRGGFEPGQAPRIIDAADLKPRTPARRELRAAPVWVDGLAVAVEKQSPVSPEL